MKSPCGIPRLAFPLICLGFLAFQSVYAAPAQNIAGAIVSVKDVATIDPGGTGAKHPAKPGDSLYAHDVVSTSGIGGVKILLKDHSILDLGPATVFKVDQYNPAHGSDREVVTSMSQGIVRSAVTEKITGNGRFHLKTPTATMGVRGTEFVVEAPAGRAGQPPQASKITVLQGEVEVEHASLQFGQSGQSRQSRQSAQSGSGGNGAASAKISLTAGQQITASASALLSTRVLTLDSATLGKISSLSKVVDNTFTRAVVIDTSSGTASGGISSSSGSSSRAPAGASSSTSSGAASAGSGSGAAASAPVSSGGSTVLIDIATAAAPATAPAAAPPPPPVVGGGGPIPGTSAGDPTSTLHPVNTVVPTNTTSTLTIVIH